MDLRTAYHAVLGESTDSASSFTHVPTPTRNIPFRGTPRECAPSFAVEEELSSDGLGCSVPEDELAFDDLFQCAWEKEKVEGERAERDSYRSLKMKECVEIEPDCDGNFSHSFGGVCENDDLRRPTLEDFNVLRLVGQGAYGKVFQVSRISTGDIYAMKVMKKEDLAKTNNIEYTLTERNILRNIRHPFIASLYCAFQTQGKVYLVMDFLNGGGLLYHMRRVGCFPEKHVKIYAAELVLALEFLHQQGIVHRDLKPENIMLNGDDFGLAKVNVTSDKGGNTFCGTVEYMAPEIVKNEEHGYAVDWWSLGVLLYDLLTGSPPFKSGNRKKLQDLIVRGKFKLPSWLSSDTHSILRGLIQKDPKKRLGSGARGVTEIKEHRFFKGIDWGRVERREIRAPYKPDVRGLQDCSLFEEKYTDAAVMLSPGQDGDTLTRSQQESFLGFSFARSIDGENLFEGICAESGGESPSSTEHEK